MMAIAHFRSKFIGQGVSPIAAAAYRHRTSLHDAAIGQTFSYAPDEDLVHAELAVPRETPQWFRDLVDGRTPEAASEALWNAILDHEKRADAQYAREIVIALPLELSRQENIALVQDYVASELTSRGFVVDWVFHDKPGNPHAHLMHTKLEFRRLPNEDRSN